MQRVSIDDPAWRSTFPHLVAPLPDEWLAGLLLRCDEVNRWNSRTTFYLLKRTINLRGPWYIPRNLIVPHNIDLDVLARWLKLPTSSLLATTYHEELARCYETTSPVSRLLTPGFSTRICPQCCDEKRLLMRNLMLPHIECCPRHHVKLMRECQCGARLQLFSPDALPFACNMCGLDWRKLPRIAPDPKRIELEHKYLALYEFFLSQGTPEILKRAWQLAKERLSDSRKRNGSYPSVEPSSLLPGPLVGPVPISESISVLVAGLVFFGLTPKDILTYDAPPLHYTEVRIKEHGFFVLDVFPKSLISQRYRDAFDFD
jgi:hypothetical protein